MSKCESDIKLLGRVLELYKREKVDTTEVLVAHSTLIAILRERMHEHRQEASRLRKRYSKLRQE